MWQNTNPAYFYSELPFSMLYLYGQLTQRSYQSFTSQPYLAIQKQSTDCMPLQNPPTNLNSDPNATKTKAEFKNEELVFKLQENQQSEYHPNGVIPEQGFKMRPSVQYCKKNTQSNIVNQVVSFICDQQRSRPVIKRYFDLEDNAFEIFYLIMKKVKKSNKNYLSRKYLIDLATFDSTQLPYKLLLAKPPKNSRNRVKPYVQDISVETFRALLRTLVRFYIQNLCTSSILTSRKIKRETIFDHIGRKRELIQLINTHQAFRQPKIDRIVQKSKLNGIDKPEDA